jgi:hypothetical protein
MRNVYAGFSNEQVNEVIQIVCSILIKVIDLKLPDYVLQGVTVAPENKN